MGRGIDERLWRDFLSVSQSAKANKNRPNAGPGAAGEHSETTEWSMHTDTVGMVPYARGFEVLDDWCILYTDGCRT